MKVIKNEILVQIPEEELLSIIKEKAGVSGNTIVKIQRTKQANTDKPEKPTWDITIA